jgi:hypothetical protein
MPKQAEKPWRRKAHFFWWTLANTVAACVALLSWVLTLHVFGHPEIPKYHRLIQRLGLAKPPPGFELQQAPPGESADPRALYRRYAALDASALQRLNRSLLRNYLTGLGEPNLIQYIEGDLEIIRTRELGPGDLFPKGFAVRARAMVQPDEFSEPTPWPVVIDYLFPTDRLKAKTWFRAGDRLVVSKIPNCAMVLHVAREIEGDTPRVVITAVPIVMSEYQVGENQRFNLITPESADPSARLPVFEPEPQPPEP